MIINIGTQNKAKVKSIVELEGFYDWFIFDEVNTFKVSSGVSDQPLSMEETILGAKNRAKIAFESKKCDLSFGLESGLVKSEFANSSYFNFEVCAIYDGNEFYLGMGGMFEYPKIIIDRMLEYNEELSTAFKNLGLSHEEKVGENDGIIGFLTHGKFTRSEVNKQQIIFALQQVNQLK